MNEDGWDGGFTRAEKCYGRGGKQTPRFSIILILILVLTYPFSHGSNSRPVERILPCRME